MKQEVYNFDDLINLELDRQRKFAREQLIESLKLYRQHNNLHRQIASLLERYENKDPSLDQYYVDREVIVDTLSSIGFLPVFSDEDGKVVDIIITKDGWAFVHAED